MTPPTETRPPWAIEIRDPAPAPAPAPGPDPSRRGPGRRLVALVVLGIACFVATIALLGALLDGGDDATDEAAPTTSTPITFAPRDETTTTLSSAPSTTAPPETTTTTAPPTTTTTAPPTTTAAPAPATGSVPALSTSFGGGWVAMLTSVPYAAGEARLEAAWQEVRRFAPRARAARGEDWGSLSDGYWVLVDPGPFGSEADARAFCAGVDRSRSDCAPRQLRHG